MVDAAVRRTLAGLGHEVFTASDIGQAAAEDRDLAVVADDMRAIFVTHDKRFSFDRQATVLWGLHIYLRCNEWDAATVLEAALPEITFVLEHKDAAWIELRPDGKVLIERGSYLRSDRDASG